MTRPIFSVLASTCLTLSLLPVHAWADAPAASDAAASEEAPAPEPASEAPASGGALTLVSITLIPPPAPEGAEPQPEPPPPEVAKPQPAPVALPLEPTIGDRPYTGKRQILAGWTMMGAGALVIATSFLTTTCDYTRGLQCKYAEYRTVWVPTSATVLMAGTITLASEHDDSS